jgi:predicted transcriptional regulator
VIESVWSLFFGCCHDHVGLIVWEGVEFVSFCYVIVLFARFCIMQFCLFFLTLLALSACAAGCKSTGQLKVDASDDVESSKVDNLSEEASSMSASSEEEKEEYIDGEDRKHPCGVKGTVNCRSSGQNVRPCKEVVGAEPSASANVLVHPSPWTARKPWYKFPKHIRTPKCINHHRMVKMTLSKQMTPKDCSQTVAQEYA